MSENIVFCTNCGSIIEGRNNFCTNCGTPVKRPEAAHSPEPPTATTPSAGEGSEEGLLRGLKARLKVVENTAGSAGNAVKGAISPEKASEAVRSMLNVMTQVAADVRRELPPDMVNAVDLEAEINLIAFSIGVSIDLEKLRTKTTDALPE